MQSASLETSIIKIKRVSHVLIYLQVKSISNDKK